MTVKIRVALRSQLQSTDQTLEQFILASLKKHYSGVVQFYSVRKFSCNLTTNPLNKMVRFSRDMLGLSTVSYTNSVNEAAL